jgi:D-xylose reductase
MNGDRCSTLLNVKRLEFAMATSQFVALRTGDQMPAVGLGVWKIAPESTPGIVLEAARIGYRHFDCASDYGNELNVGQGLAALMKEGVCRREDMWITSKLWNTNHAAEHVRPAAERSLTDLQVDYLDLYLIHFPIALHYVPPSVRYPAGWIYDPDADEPRMESAAVPISETWGAMEELVQAGLVRNIGVCNFGVALLRDLSTYAAIQPASLQVEMHPRHTQEKLLRYCQEADIAVTAFSPLGSPSYVPLGMATAEDSLLDDPIVTSIAAAHRKTAAQALLRWGIQRGTAVIPKSSRPERLRENISLFDFELSAAEMNAISSLNQNRRFNDPGDFCESAFNTFFPIYE